MNDHDDLDPHLRARMERAVGGLRAPDLTASAIARGRRERTRRRLAQGVGGVAAGTAIVLAVPAFAGDGPADTAESSGRVAEDRSSTGPTTGSAGDDGCAAATTGWWSKPTDRIRAELAALLPAGTRIGATNDRWPGTWGGNLVTEGDADFASLTLLPPPGVPGGRRSLEELADGGACGGGANEPLQPVEPCAALADVTTCEEIRSEDGGLVGVVTERVERSVVEGREQPTDRSYVLATLAVRGGHVELYVAEGTRADQPGTVHAPTDVPALTVTQARAVVTDPVWTS